MVNMLSQTFTSNDKMYVFSPPRSTTIDSGPRTWPSYNLSASRR